MHYKSLVALLTVVSAGFFDSGNFEEFKAKLQAAHENLLDKSGVVRDDVFDTWSPNELHEWLSYHKVDTPGTDNTGALVAKAREHKSKLVGDIKDLFEHPPPSEKIITKGAEFYSQAAESAGKAASNAGKAASNAGKAASNAASNLFSTWSDSALAAYLTARGQDVTNVVDHDKLVELANKYKNAAIDTKDKVSRSWLDSWSREDLEKALSSFGSKVEGTRKQLADELYSSYTKAKDSAAEGQKQGEKHANEAIKAIEKWHKDTFDKWSLDDLKEYVSQFTPHQPTKKEQLVDAAKSNWNYFVYGETAPTTLWSQFIRYAHLAEVHLGAGFSGIKNKILAAKEDL